MNRETKRRMALVGVAGALVIAVVADRAGLFSGAGDEARGAREVYLEEAAIAEEMRSVAARVDAERVLVEQTSDAWNRARERMITARSADIASTRLRDIVERIMGDLGLTLAVSDATQPRRLVEGEGLYLIGLDLSFEALNPDVVYRLVDRLEHLPEARTNVANLSITGPGRGPRAGIDVTMKLQALSWIGEEG
ncbi:MAG: hypothetical protein VYC34_02235 [Planctomycetota bacterium]|nr:hypothetical protein [Planctomycetota bacterium]